VSHRYELAAKEEGSVTFVVSRYDVGARNGPPRAAHELFAARTPLETAWASITLATTAPPALLR
jgi:hypothetical protein